MFFHFDYFCTEIPIWTVCFIPVTTAALVCFIHIYPVTTADLVCVIPFSQSFSFLIRFRVPHRWIQLCPSVVSYLSYLAPDLQSEAEITLVRYFVSHPFLHLPGPMTSLPIVIAVISRFSQKRLLQFS